MKASIQIGKELGELRCRIEALERMANVSSDPRSTSTSAVQAEPSMRPEHAPTARKLAPSGIVHRSPNVPLFVDGEILADPQEIQNFNGRPLYYTPLRIQAGIALAAYTDPQKMIFESRKLASALVAGKTARSSEHNCQLPPYSLPEDVSFFEHVNEDGDVLRLPPARAYSDLTRVSRGFLGSGDWNDFISSVTWCRWDVSLFEHVHYGGSQLWLPAGCNTPNLVELGWNDRASSIVNWGQRFSSQPVLA